ncbi:hypothetical protein HDU96_002796 [Phlyctochytrium bullatum]|nr:hypothetical protein HDU96_002796 [Phlyctochytrium bullatum]
MFTIPSAAVSFILQSSHWPSLTPPLPSETIQPPTSFPLLRPLRLPPIVTVAGTSETIGTCGSLRGLGNARCVDAFKGKPYDNFGPNSGDCITRSAAYADECIRAVDSIAKQVFTYTFSYPSAASAATQVPAPTVTTDTLDIPDIPAPNGTPTTDPNGDDKDDGESTPIAERWGIVGRSEVPVMPRYQIELVKIVTRDVSGGFRGCTDAEKETVIKCRSELNTEKAKKFCATIAFKMRSKCGDAFDENAKRHNKGYRYPWRLWYPRWVPVSEEADRPHRPCTPSQC